MFWGLAFCCCLFCCVLVAVAIAFAGTSAANSKATTTTTATTTTGITATIPPAPPASTDTFTPAPTVGGASASLLDDTQAAVLSLRANVVDERNPLALELLCNVPFAGNTTMVSYFTYTAHSDLFIAIGASNKISPRPANRGQTEYFAKGHSVGGASIAWNRALSPITWHVRALPTSNALAINVPTSAIACPSLLSLVA